VTESEEDKPPQNAEGERGQEPEFRIAQSKALVPLLVVAGLAVFVILLNITRARTFVPAEGAPANQAFRPKDFPSIIVKVEPPARESSQGNNALFPVPPPPFSDGIYPCTSCHDDTMPANPERRPLETVHDDIVLHHDEEHRWCLDCHDANNRDQLHLASGAPVSFQESYQLCGQCHGTQFRDWRVGIHGKRSGYWEGPKRYLLCVHCHNPHSPRFSALEPLPPPVRPQFLRSANLPAPAAAAPAEPGASR
jgi:hypothetical protein